MYPKLTSFNLFRFKWVHLSEQLNYEKARKMQKMRTETEQVRYKIFNIKITQFNPNFELTNT